MKINIKDIVIILSFIVSILGSYFSLKEKVNINSIKIQYLEENNRIWIKQGKILIDSQN